jgi:carboxymethylenebutenolidase
MVSATASALVYIEASPFRKRLTKGDHPMENTVVTPQQAAMVELWEQHMAAEFAMKDVDATMATMTSRPFVNHVPVMTGGVGYEEVRDFYARFFLTGHPPDTAVVLVARTVGQNRVVDEMSFSFTHTLEMPWMLPGIKPTHKRVEVPVVAVVLFEDGKIAGERIYWDQASVLAQIGFIDSNKLPVTDAGSSRKVLDPVREPSNRLIHRLAG